MTLGRVPDDRADACARPGVDPSWRPALDAAATSLAAVEAFLATEVAEGRRFLPPAPDVLRALRLPASEVRVLVVGQDPYPTPGHSMGLAFSVRPGVRPLPASLRNIVTELRDDVAAHVPGPAAAGAVDGDLSAWSRQGVLLLNRVLTVAPGEPGSHRRRGWEEVTAAVIAQIVTRHDAGQPVVAVLWGRDAQSLQPALGSVPVVASVHPSPLSARRGFFGSRPFSRVNALLVEQGAAPIDWTLAAPGTLIE